jgi:CAAX protease family protein
VTRVQRAIAAELAAIGCVAVYSIMVTRMPRRARLPANLGAAAALAGFARVSGVSLSELGLSRANIGRGNRIGVVAAVPLAVTSAAAVANPRTRRLVADEKITGTSPGEAVFETLVRIPLETALSEELIFRGVLLGLGLRSRSRGWAIVTSSMLFGLWHAVPALGAPEPGATSRPYARATTSTAAVVATTAMAGAGFAWLRLRAGSVLAPTLAHAALNMAAFAGVRITSRSTRPLRSPTPFRVH